MMEDNRIELAVGRVETALAKLPAGKRERLDAGLAITFAEHVAYQDAKSRAQASDRISLAEALSVYHALGENYTPVPNGGWARGTTTAMKVAVTKLMGEIMQPPVGARRYAN